MFILFLPADLAMHRGKGLNHNLCTYYDFSTPEELEFIQDVAVKTGIFFDRVYSGKALKKTIEYIKDHQLENSIFIHTGGVHSISDHIFVDFLKQNEINSPNKNKRKRLDKN